MSKKIIAGVVGDVTAYAYAKAGGYTGTEEEFQALMAANVEAAKYADEVRAAAAAANEDKEAAAESKDAAAASASAAAASQADAATSKAAAETAANYARTYTGAPRVAATAAAMTDQSLIYVYTGSETGYTAGNWYFWDGTTWTSGGVYNSTALETDETLTVSGAAADAKVTGDEIGALKSASNDNVKTMQKVASLDSRNISFGMDGAVKKKSLRKDGSILDDPDSEYKIFPYFGGNIVTECDDRGNCHLAFFDSTMTVIPDSGASWQLPQLITCPERTAYFGITTRIETGSNTVVTQTLAIIDTINDTRKDLSSAEYGIHHLSISKNEISIDLRTAIKNKTISTDGTFITEPSTEIIRFPYLGGRVFVENSDRGNGIYAFYDAIGSYISQVRWQLPAEIKNIPANTAFIAVNITSSSAQATAITQTAPKNEKLNAIDLVTVSPRNRNGSGGNAGNTDFITLANDGYIRTNFANAVRAIVDFPLQEGYCYHWYWSLSNDASSYPISGIADTYVPFIDINVENYKYVAINVTRVMISDTSVYDSVRTNDVGYYSLKGILLYLPANDSNSNILTRNKDVLPAVYASSRYGVHSGGMANTNKQFSMLITTDVHASEAAFNSAIQYLNSIPSIDAGCCLGDIVASYASESAEWYSEAVNKSEKPFYTVIGNHEKGITADNRAVTNEVILDKYITPTMGKIGKEVNKLYYSVDVPNYNIYLVILDNYDTPNEMTAGAYPVRRGAECFTQTQIDWLINTLKQIPEGRTLVILMHSYYNPSVGVDCIFTQPGKKPVGSSPYLYPASENIIPSIINAWKNGASLTKTVNPETDFVDIVPTLDISCDFTERGAGSFACYLVGHTHWDAIARSEQYPDQLIINTCATSNDLWQNYESDLPRAQGTKAQDAITVVSIDKIAQKVNLVRVGSNISFNMVNRTMISLPW